MKKPKALSLFERDVEVLNEEVAKIEKAAEAPELKLPRPVATRSFANDQWEPWLHGQRPSGARGVVAIEFEDGFVFDVGHGWQR